MRHSILMLSSTLLLCVPGAQAQDSRKLDSMLTVWANDQARYSRLTCAGVEQMVRDSAHKIIVPIIAGRNGPHARATDGALAYPMDSASVAFVIKKRIRIELLK